MFLYDLGFICKMFDLISCTCLQLETVAFLYMQFHPLVGVWGSTTMWGPAQLSPCR